MNERQESKPYVGTPPSDTKRTKMREKWKHSPTEAGFIVALVILVILYRSFFPNLMPNAVTVDQVPPYSGIAYAVINDNVPVFSNDQLVTESYEYYSPLDDIGRCGYTIACVGKDLMPSEERGSISHVKPTGWVQAEYEIVDGGSLYNRCHLIGFQLTGENANKQNLITGTRYMNVEGMLPFENMVADYVKETGNHVIYRVTPIFDGDDLLASGVQIEAQSVEDQGEGISFNVYVYNVQPGVIIDYTTGESRLDPDYAPK